MRSKMGLSLSVFRSVFLYMHSMHFWHSAFFAYFSAFLLGFKNSRTPLHQNNAWTDIVIVCLLKENVAIQLQWDITPSSVSDQVWWEASFLSTFVMGLGRNRSRISELKDHQLHSAARFVHLKSLNIEVCFCLGFSQVRGVCPRRTGNLNSRKKLKTVFHVRIILNFCFCELKE